MNKIRVLVQVIVMVGILTGCDSCDDGMDYPIVEYAQGVTPTAIRQQQIEQLRVALKAHPDIKFLEIRGGTDTMVVGRIGNRAIFGIGNFTISSPLSSESLQAMVNDIVTNHDNLSQLFGAPAGLAVVTDSPSVITDSPSVITDSPAVVTDSPAVITDSSAVITDGLAVITDSPAVVTDGLAVITRG